MKEAISKIAQERVEVGNISHLIACQLFQPLRTIESDARPPKQADHLRIVLKIVLAPNLDAQSFRDYRMEFCDVDALGGRDGRRRLRRR